VAWPAGGMPQWRPSASGGAPDPLGVQHRRRDGFANRNAPPRRIRELYAMSRFFTVAVCAVVTALWIGPAGSELAAAPPEAAASQQAGQPQKLFDGRTLEGWEGNREIFRVQDGAIVGGTLKQKIDHNWFLCTTKEYGDFELRLKCKLIGEGANAGIQFRTKRIPNHYEVSGYQADMGQQWWGKLYDESRRRRVLAGPESEAEQAKLAAVLKPNDWNEYVIRCQGPRIQIWLNGLQTVDYTEQEEGIERTGIVAVQIHGGPPSEAWYKDIELVELK
jgi:hypothetical protein